MSHPSFAQMPDPARVWVFATPRALSSDESGRLLSRVDDFVSRWLAHGHPVVGAREWRDDRFLLIAADEEATGVSGCSIDSLYRVLKEVEAEIGVPLTDASRVWYRGGDEQVRSATRAEFRELAQRGEVHGETQVFDNTVASVGAVRAGAWERPLRESWHAKAFSVGAER